MLLFPPSFYKSLRTNYYTKYTIILISVYVPLTVMFIFDQKRSCVYVGVCVTVYDYKKRLDP